MNVLIALHQRLGFALVLVTLVGTRRSLGAVRRESWRPAQLVFLRLCVATVAVEAVAGLVLILTGHSPAQGIHWFYAGATLLAIPIGELMSRSAAPSHQGWIVAAGAAAAFLFSIRAITTGG